MARTTSFLFTGIGLFTMAVGTANWFNGHLWGKAVFFLGIAIMIGMFIGWACWAYLGLDPMLGAFVALVVTFLFGMILQRLLIKHLLPT